MTDLAARIIASIAILWVAYRALRLLTKHWPRRDPYRSNDCPTHGEIE